jgi:hypothetical protein
MADIALVTANRVEIVGIPVRQTTLAAAEAIVAGAPIIVDANGKWVNSDADGAGTLDNVKAIATRTGAAGESITGLEEGRLGGYDLSSQAFGAAIYVSNTVGRLADAAGTKSLVVGNVEPVGSNQLANAHNKVLNVNIPAAIVA